MASKIGRIEYYLPKKTITNKEFEIQFGRWEAEKIEKKLGIAERHVAGEHETALDLAFEASNLVLKDYDKEKIDFILLCTQSPDYFLPTSACILQDKLGLRKDIGALDFNLGCSGYIYGLALVKGLIQSKVANNVLLLMSETYSKHIHPKDLANRTIFGDGAAATIVERTDLEHIHEFILGTNGAGMDNLIVKNGGMRNSKNDHPEEIVNESGDISNSNCLFMNGPEIFNFTIEAVPIAIESVLKKNNIELDEVDYFIFHQANKYMIDFLRKKIKIPEEKFFSDMSNTGNTVSATIPIGLKKAFQNQKIKEGSKVLLCGFGVGYSWGATIITI